MIWHFSCTLFEHATLLCSQSDCLSFTHALAPERCAERAIKNGVQRIYYRWTALWLRRCWLTVLADRCSITGPQMSMCRWQLEYSTQSSQRIDRSCWQLLIPFTEGNTSSFIIIASPEFGIAMCRLAAQQIDVWNVDEAEPLMRQRFNRFLIREMIAYTSTQIANNSLKVIEHRDGSMQLYILRLNDECLANTQTILRNEHISQIKAMSNRKRQRHTARARWGGQQWETERQTTRGKNTKLIQLLSNKKTTGSHNSHRTVIELFRWAAIRSYRGSVKKTLSRNKSKNSSILTANSLRQFFLLFVAW